MMSLLESIKTKIRTAPATTELTSGQLMILVAMFTIMLVSGIHEPGDDLKRHLIAYLYDFDYSKLYIHAQIPHYNLYPVFDYLVGKIHATLGYPSFILVQAAAMLLTGIALIELTRGMQGNMRAITISVVLLLIIERIMVARPTTFANALFLLAYAWAQEKKHVRGLVAASLLASIYHLFFLYLIPLALMRKVFWIPLVTGMMGWLLYAGWEYVSVVQGLLTGAGAEIPVTEGAPIWCGYLMLAPLLLPVAVFWRREKATLLNAVFFTLSNQVRYFETIIPLLSRFIKYYEFRPTNLVTMAVIVACATRIIGAKEGEPAGPYRIWQVNTK